MLENRERVRTWVRWIIQQFRNKGATSPDKAMTTEELGLPPRFEEAMKRRLGKIGLFIEIDGKYYLSEDKLKELRSKTDSSKTPQ